MFPQKDKKKICVKYEKKKKNVYSFNGTYFEEIGTFRPSSITFEWYGDSEVTLNGIIYARSQNLTTGFSSFYAYNISSGNGTYIDLGGITMSDQTVTNNNNDMLYMCDSVEDDPVFCEKKNFAILQG